MIVFSSCSSTNNFTYLNNIKTNNDWGIEKEKLYFDVIQIGDILKIDISAKVQEAAVIYNKNNSKQSISLDMLKLESYLVDNGGYITFPVLGKLYAKNIKISEFSEIIKNLLIDGQHLTSPNVNIRRINSKFTVLGEVKSAGTFSFYEQINIFQAIGYAGDLTIDGKKTDITLIRQKENIREIYKINLTDSDFLSSDNYFIKNNDVIIVNPTFKKVKSGGFIGSPTSIASIASLVLSITLLLLNK